MLGAPQDPAAYPGPVNNLFRSKCPIIKQIPGDGVYYLVDGVDDGVFSDYDRSDSRSPEKK